MYLEEWENGCLTILLSNSELDGWGLCFDSLNPTDPVCRQGLSNLLSLAKKQTGIPLDQRVRVEALPVEQGCLLLVTPLPRRRRLRMRRTESERVYTIASTDHLLAMAVAVKPPLPVLYSSIYRWGEGYRLVVAPLPGFEPIDRILTEYGRLIGKGGVTAAITAEHGVPLVEGDGLERLIEGVTGNGYRPPDPPDRGL